MNGNYPLMSTAMESGLYHPRCKDSHGTYFPGISEEPDDKWTRKELDEVKQQSKEDVRQQNARRRFEYCDRLASNLLEPEERQKYAARADDWKKIANNSDETVVKNSKSDIINKSKAIDSMIIDSVDSESLYTRE